ncbi:unnamed protein product, partial [Mesorhabditis belari]|uniref:Oligopeptide transporter 1 n=1 Tax=Mesorhabditis belari TaxID=2138241 RepID=A0AAF3FR64_9BILA
MAKKPRSDTDEECSSSSGQDVAKRDFKEPTTWPEMIRAWPKTTFCIVSNEFCERFSYYGMRTVLTFYLLNVLKFSDSQSTIFFNGFTVLCYFTPILGSIVADGFVGKFWTIFAVSILYAAGQIILALASTKDSSSSIHPWMDMIGLVTIGFGTGGIKPCVSAFGGDQFEKGHERMLSMFFSMFYFSINAGSMISTFIAPIFRSMSCMGQDSCYPLAFGVPAILMIVATCLFMAGSFWYKKPPPTENVFAEVFRIIRRALGNKMRASEPKEHWLDHYMTTHVCESDPRCMQLKQDRRSKKACHKLGYVDDVRQLLRLLIMFLPVPMFWALYDQQGSVWLIQGIQMDCRLWGNVLFMPDQVQVLNAVLILCFIPIFQVFIYPLASKVIVLTPLRKMVAGGFLAAISFMITGFVQLRVNQTLAVLPDSGQAFVSFFNMHPNCTFTVQGPDEIVNFPFNYSQQDVRKHGDIPESKSFHVPKGYQNFTINYTDGDCTTNADLPRSVGGSFESKKVYFFAINTFGAVYGEVDTDKPEQGTGEFNAGFLMAMNTPYGQADNNMDNLVLCRANDDGTLKKCDPRKPADFYYWEGDYNQGKDDREDKLEYQRAANKAAPNVSGVTLYVQQYSMKPVKPGKWWLHKMHDTPKNAGSKTPKETDVTSLNASIYIRAQGGVYLFGIISLNPSNPELAYVSDGYMPVMQIVQDNSVSILWQVPQIVVLTAAEILFSITGYEFAYSQCAPTMKSVVQAAWLFTTAIGDGIIVGITAWSPFSNMATMFFVYAIAMAVIICVFALMAVFYYDYKSYTAVDVVEHDDDDEDDDEGRGKDDHLGHDNAAFYRLPPEDKYSDFLDADVRF